MSKLFAHITPSVLRWARQTAGFEIDDVVVTLQQKKVSKDKGLIGWEQYNEKIHSWHNDADETTLEFLEYGAI